MCEFDEQGLMSRRYASINDAPICEQERRVLFLLSDAASYVTGAHSMKVGYQGNRLDQLDQTLTDSTNLAYRFNLGVPNAVTYRLPDFAHRTLTNLHGVYAQDSWTSGRVTLQGALRYDHPWSWFPAVTQPKSTFFPGVAFERASG